MTNPWTGRVKPYTEHGIKRLKCQRCGNQAQYQWNCCSNGNRWVPVCGECDVELNILALDFFKIKGRKALIKKYRATKGGSN